MKLSTNLIRFHEAFGLLRTIDIYAEAGYEAIDFNTDLEEYHTDAHDRAFYAQIRTYAVDRGIVFSQSHAPFPSSFFEKEKTALRFEQILRGMTHAAWLGSEMIVVHPWTRIPGEEAPDNAALLAYNVDFYKRLLPHARELGIQIAIENISGSITQTPEGLLALLELLDDPVFTVCYDVGHANFTGIDPTDAIRLLGNRIGCTHIHDNNGVQDQHTLPFWGTICWEAVMKAFAQIGYTGNLSFEAGCFVNNVPEQLRPKSAAYMAEIGRYLIDRFHFFQSN